VAGVREAVGSAGAVVAPGEPDALADAVARRLAEPAFAREEGLEGRRRAAANHALPDKTARIAQLTAAVLAARSGQ
jgi:glycosyltransferase involved in cell wall biosynthesis